MEEYFFGLLDLALLQKQKMKSINIILGYIQKYCSVSTYWLATDVVKYYQMPTFKYQIPWFNYAGKQ